MQTVTAPFDTKMSLNTRPKLTAEVEFQQLTVGAAEDAEFTATGENVISDLDQLSNGVNSLTNYATLESGRWPLDGSTLILPDVTTGQIGAWSDELSATDKTFTTPLILTVSFSSVIDSVGLTIYFDTAQGGYPPAFTINVYNGVTLSETINATATSSTWVYETPVNDYDKLEIEISEWSEAEQRARIAQVYFGLVQIFGDEETVEFSVFRQIDPVNASNPASELRFAFDNRDGKYDFENPSGIYDYVTLRQETFARLGFAGELIPLGVYYVTKWETNQSTGKATFQALDALSLLDVTFTDETYTSQTLTTIATAALTQAGIASYSLDSSLGDITVTATLEGKTCREVLVNIAIATCLTLYVDTDGVLTIGALPTVAEDYTITYANSQKPVGSLADPLKSISVTYDTDTAVTASYEDYGQEINISNNPFIQTEARANAVLAWLAAYYQRRKNYRNDWRQNPKIECGDIIGITTDYGTPTATVTSQQYTYSAGGLTGQTNSKGVT